MTESKSDGCWGPYYASDPPCITWMHRECLRDYEKPEEPSHPEHDPKPGTVTCVRCGRTVQ